MHLNSSVELPVSFHAENPSSERGSTPCSQKSFPGLRCGQENAVNDDGGFESCRDAG